MNNVAPTNLLLAIIGLSSIGVYFVNRLIHYGIVGYQVREPEPDVVSQFTNVASIFTWTNLTGSITHKSSASGSLYALAGGDGYVLGVLPGVLRGRRGGRGYPSRQDVALRG